MILVMFHVSEWAHTVLEILKLNKQTFVQIKKIFRFLLIFAKKQC